MFGRNPDVGLSGLFLYLLMVVGNRLGAVFDVQFFHDLGHVIFDGLFAEVQALSDICIDQPLRGQA